MPSLGLRGFDLGRPIPSSRMDFSERGQLRMDGIESNRLVVMAGPMNREAAGCVSCLVVVAIHGIRQLRCVGRKGFPVREEVNGCTNLEITKQCGVQACTYK